MCPRASPTRSDFWPFENPRERILDLISISITFYAAALTRKILVPISGTSAFGPLLASNRAVISMMHDMGSVNRIDGRLPVVQAERKVFIKKVGALVCFARAIKAVSSDGGHGRGGGCHAWGGGGTQGPYG